MNVSSLVALIGLLIDGKLLGMSGMVIALPVVAALPVMLDFAGIHIKTKQLNHADIADPAGDVT